MIERIRGEAIVGTNRDRKEVAVVRDERSIFFQRTQDRLFFDAPGVWNHKAGFETDALTHRRITRRGRGDGRCVMIGRIDIFAPRLRDDDSQGVLHHSALAFIVTHERRKHRQTRRVPGSPASRTQRVGIQIELRAVRGLPAARCQLRQPGFPNRAGTGRDDDGVAIAAGVVHVLLPLLQRQVARSARPRFDREIRRDRITAVRKRATIEVGFVRIIEEGNRHARLVIGHEDVIHLIKRAERPAIRREVARDLRDDRIGV